MPEMHILIPGGAARVATLEQHWQKHGYVIVKHISSYIAILHGSKNGELPMLSRVQAVAANKGIAIKHYVCCYPAACRKTHPGLPILGGYDDPQGWLPVDDGIIVFIDTSGYGIRGRGEAHG